MPTYCMYSAKYLSADKEEGQRPFGSSPASSAQRREYSRGIRADGTILLAAGDQPLQIKRIRSINTLVDNNAVKACININKMFKQNVQTTWGDNTKASR